MTIWEAPEEIRQLVGEIKEAYHPHLILAKIWVLINDASPIVENQLVPMVTSRCTKTEKLKSGNDFKIIVVAEAWGLLTTQQKRVAIDEALCHCGVQYVPLTQKINKKDEVIKDEIGRIIYTDVIATDGEGLPKWKMNRPDASIYFGLIQRHEVYSEALENVQNALEKKPIKKIMAAIQPDADDGLSDSDNSDVE